MDDRENPWEPFRRLSREERRESLEKARGSFSHLKESSDDFLRERRDGECYNPFDAEVGEVRALRP